ncbi:MAG: hypothetical protein ACRD42_01695 [Nitrososphaeraceae archaeon]
MNNQEKKLLQDINGGNGNGKGEAESCGTRSANNTDKTTNSVF